MKHASIVILAFVLGGCAAHYAPGANSDPYGFFSGLLHGIVFPYAVVANIVSWILSLVGVSFMEGIQILGRPNTGFLFYYVGYALGLSFYFGAAASD